MGSSRASAARRSNEQILSRLVNEHSLSTCVRQKARL